MYLNYKWGFHDLLENVRSRLRRSHIFLKKSIENSCAFGARILSNYSNRYAFIYQYQIFLCHYQSWFMEKNQGHNREYNLTRRLFTLTMVVKIGFCLDIGFFLLDIYQWAHWEDLGRTFRKGVRPWAQDFVWPNAPLFLTEMVKRHIYGPRPFIWAYNQVSMTFRSKVLARTSSSLEKPLFWAILAHLTTSRRHIYGPRPFIWHAFTRIGRISYSWSVMTWVTVTFTVWHPKQARSPRHMRTN